MPGTLPWISSTAAAGDCADAVTINAPALCSKISQAVAAVPHPEFTLFGLCPVFEVRPPGKLVVERLDQPGEHHEIAVTEQALVRGAFLDFAKSGVALAPGGIYRAKLTDREIVFKIDPHAKPGDAPLVGRLARLQVRH